MLMKKIVHVQLTGFGEGLGYQENMLLKYHKKLGYEVTMITSCKAFFSGGHKYVEPGENHLGNGVKIIRLCYVPFIPKKVSSRLSWVRGLTKALENEKPDVIFVHGISSVSLCSIVRLVSFNAAIKVYVDNHADFYNSAQNWISKLVHKTLWRYMAKKLEKIADSFFTITAGCKKFMEKYYAIPPEKIELLQLGGDPEFIDKARGQEIRTKVREQLGFKDSDLVLITGGKLDGKKEVISLMKIVKELSHKNLKLIVFGSVHESIAEEFYSINDITKNICYVGWLNLSQTYEYFLASDLAVFPGTQSALWNHAIFCGLPAIFRRWEGMTDFTISGKYRPCILVENCEQLKKEIEELLWDQGKLKKLKDEAKKVSKWFSYEFIARRAIGI